MQTESRELLAVGILGGKSRIGDRIEILLRRGRTFSPRAWAVGVAAGTVILGGLTFSGSLAPRRIAFAQQTSEPSFEVASIKRDVSGEPVTYARWFPSLHIERLKNLVILAWRVQDFQVTGGPGRVDSDRYNIDAKAEGPPSFSQDYVTLQYRRLQTLPHDRFNLTIHREMKELPVYELTVAKGGPKLQSPNCLQREPGDFTIAPGRYRGLVGGSMASGRLQASGTTMANLARSLSHMLGRMVVDRTGITGEFDLRLSFTPDSPNVPSPLAPAAADPGPDIFIAMQEQLGLKLESAKGPVEFLVIDHVEKPDAN
jgi:uncharacterized protein (TIGR03435 family)